MAATGAPPADHTVVAHNTATESTNKIHDDGVAQAYGFRGGLVPGVDVYAYLAHLPVREWGPGWLAHGSMAARFVTPVYDGRRVTVSGAWDDEALDLTVHDGAMSCATGRAGRVGVRLGHPRQLGARQRRGVLARTFEAGLEPFGRLGLLHGLRLRGAPGRARGGRQR